MDIKEVLLEWFINFWLKSSAMHTNKFAGCGIKNENMSNKDLPKELHKLIIRKFKKRKVYSSVYI